MKDVCIMLHSWNCQVCVLCFAADILRGLFLSQRGSKSNWFWFGSLIGFHTVTGKYVGNYQYSAHAFQYSVSVPWGAKYFPLRRDQNSDVNTQQHQTWISLDIYKHWSTHRRVTFEAEVQSVLWNHPAVLFHMRSVRWMKLICQINLWISRKTF